MLLATCSALSPRDSVDCPAFVKTGSQLVSHEEFYLYGFHISLFVVQTCLKILPRFLGFTLLSLTVWLPFAPSLS